MIPSATGCWNHCASTERCAWMKSSEAQAVRCKHADFFLAFAEQAEPGLTGPQQGKRLASLETEHNNLRAAVMSYIEEWGDRSSAAHGLCPMAFLEDAWILRRRTEVCSGRFFRWKQVRLCATVARAKALHGAGLLASAQGDYRISKSFCQREPGNLAGVRKQEGHR